jgi:organic radical activating enzyme
MDSVRLIENFVTWQGEGPDSGRRMVLLRFKTCNLHCPWCDTAVKMRVSAEASYPISDIQSQINENECGLMITGGEPTVKRHFNETVTLLNELEYSVANVETNGFGLLELIQAVDSRKNVKYILSPKVFESNDSHYYADLANHLGNLDFVFIKMVYQGNIVENLFLSLIKGSFPSSRLWLMPEGVTKKDLIKNSEIVFDACEKYNANFSSRNHIIYGFI